MKINRLVFSIVIKAEQSKIWKALWDDDSYREWVSIFSKGSYFVTDNWDVGSKVLFLAPDKSGIYSLIEEHSPNYTILFKHIGTVLNGEEQAVDEQTNSWSGAKERYTLTDGLIDKTLTVEIDVLDEHLEFMTDRLPKALDKIKELCGKQS